MGTPLPSVTITSTTRLVPSQPKHGPNPVESIWSFALGRQEAKYIRWAVRNTSGQKVYGPGQIKNEDLQLDFSAQVPGSYFVQIEADGEKQWTTKVVKTK